MFARPTILCRRSSEGAHQLVVSFPEGHADQTVDQFAERMGIEDYERLSGNRISFTLGPGPALSKLLRAALSGQIGGYPVVRALFHPESFVGETAGCELETVQAAEPPEWAKQAVPATPPRTSRSIRAGPALAVGISFLLGMLALAVLRGPEPTAAGAGEETPATVQESPESVPVDLGTFVAARGTTAAFQAEDGSLRYAVAGGSLEGRLGARTEIWAQPGVRPGLVTPVRELRDPDGLYTFDRVPAPPAPPALASYGTSLDEALAAELAWDSAADSTRSFYALRAGWRKTGPEPIRIEGTLEETEQGLLLRAGPIGVFLADVDGIDDLNVSLALTGRSRVRIYGRIGDEGSWETLRFDPAHPAFSVQVDWIEPELPGSLWRAADSSEAIGPTTPDLGG